MPQFLAQPPAGGCTCYNLRIPGSEFGNLDGCTMMGNTVNANDYGWIDVKLGFTEIPNPTPVFPEVEEGQPYQPATDAVCPTFDSGAEGFGSSLLYAAGLPKGARVWIQNNEGQYVLANASWPSVAGVNFDGTPAPTPYASLSATIKVKESFSTTQTITGEGYTFTKTCEYFTSATDFLPGEAPNQGNQFVQVNGRVDRFSTACSSQAA